MDTQLKAKWVAALRSKRYRQTTGNLRDQYGSGSYGYCCLGVLCHTMGARWKQGVPFIKDLRMKIHGEAYLSPETLQLVGLSDGTQRELASMNDGPAKFPEIADWIEKNV
jgi:hypothetical protein